MSRCMPAALPMLPSVTRPATLARLLLQTARSYTVLAINTRHTTRPPPTIRYPPPMAIRPICHGRRGWDGPGASDWVGPGVRGQLIGTAHGAGASRRPGVLTPDTTALTERPMALEARQRGVRGAGPLHPAICIGTSALQRRWGARRADSMLGPAMR